MTRCMSRLRLDCASHVLRSLCTSMVVAHHGKSRADDTPIILEARALLYMMTRSPLDLFLDGLRLLSAPL